MSFRDAKSVFDQSAVQSMEAAQRNGHSIVASERLPLKFYSLPESTILVEILSLSFLQQAIMAIDKFRLSNMCAARPVGHYWPIN